MGIGNDIRPKTSYHYQAKEKHIPVKSESEETDPELEEATDHLSSFSKYEEESEPDESFFDGRRTEEKDTKKHHKSKLGSWIMWILLLAVAATLVFRNWSTLYHLVFPEESSVVSSTPASTNTYTSTGSTTTDTSSSSSASSAATTGSTPSSATTPTTTTPAPTTTATNKAFAIEVLNGNGIAGSADTVRDSLVTAGFNVTKVANAKSFSYASTYIYYKTGKEASAALVKAALPTRTCIEKLSNTVTGSLYDVVVVVGAK